LQNAKKIYLFYQKNIMPTTITIQTTVSVPIEKVWEYFTAAAHIIQWNNASADWHTPTAANDLKEGGLFNFRMEAKDGSFGFDFFGTYDTVNKHQLIAYTMGDGRKASIAFTAVDNNTRIVEIIETENENPVELQKTGWQAILDNFKKYAEKNE
jgi:uncharacterized protein YndB with AHSA1/START domain